MAISQVNTTDYSFMLFNENSTVYIHLKINESKEISLKFLLYWEIGLHATCNKF